MNKRVLLIIMLLASFVASNAKIKDSILPFSLSYRTDFSNISQVGIKYSTYKPNRIGLDAGYFMGFPNGNLNYSISLNLGATYTYMLKNTRNYSLFLSVGAGPVYTINSLENSSKKYVNTTEMAFGAYINPQISYSVKNFVFSAGAYGEAPNFKFKKEDGAYMGLSLSIGYIFF